MCLDRRRSLGNGARRDFSRLLARWKMCSFANETMMRFSGVWLPVLGGGNVFLMSSKHRQDKTSTLASTSEPVYIHLCEYMMGILPRCEKLFTWYFLKNSSSTFCVLNESEGAPWIALMFPWCTGARLGEPYYTSPLSPPLWLSTKSSIMIFSSLQSTF